MRLRFGIQDDGGLLFSVWVYPDAEARKRGIRLRGSGSGAELQEEKGARFVYYGDRENRISYRLKDGRLVLEGKYTKSVDPQPALDLSGEWVKVDQRTRPVSDMPGNVWNWCTDWYDENFYANGPAVNPTGPASGEHRVIRGGCWGREAKFARSACRLTCVPVPRSCKVGFRVLLETAE